MPAATEPIKKLLSECVDSSELADALGVCEETIRRRSDQGKIPFLRNGVKRLYHIPTVLKAMTDHGEAA